MNNIQKVIENGFKLIYMIESENYYFEKNGHIFSISTPHKGTHLKWMLRANKEDEFDRWSNSDYESFHDDENEVLYCMNEYIFNLQSDL